MVIQNLIRFRSLFNKVKLCEGKFVHGQTAGRPGTNVYRVRGAEEGSGGGIDFREILT